MGQSRVDLKTRFARNESLIFTSALDDDGIEAAIVTTNAYVTIVKIDARGYRKIVIESKNEDGANAIDIRVLASRKHRKDSSLSEAFWDGTGTDFRQQDEQLAVAASAYAADVELDLKGWSFIVIQAKANIANNQGDLLSRVKLLA